MSTGPEDDDAAAAALSPPPETEQPGGDSGAADLGARAAARLLTARFWLLFGVSVVLTGSGLSISNNLAQICAAAGIAPAQSAAVLGTFSVSSCAGRVALGAAADAALGRAVSARAGAPPPTAASRRALWLALVAVGTAGAHTALARGGADAPRAARALVPVVGFFYGGFWALMPSLAADLFGADGFALTYGLLRPAVILGSWAFAKHLAARDYDQTGGFDGAFGALAACAACAALASAALAALVAPPAAAAPNARGSERAGRVAEGDETINEKSPLRPASDNAPRVARCAVS